MAAAVAPKSIAVAPVRIEWRPLADTEAMLPAWHRLADCALEPNVFYEPAFARAALPVFGGGVGAGLVWLQDKLIGFFPGRVTHRYGIPPKVLVGWTHPYAPLGTPLIDRDDGAIALGAWLDHLGHGGSLPALWLVPFLSDGPFARGLDAALAIRGAPSASFGEHRRALLAPRDRPDYLARSMSTGKLKQLRRLRRGLEQAGPVSVAVAIDGSSIGGPLDEFLALEAAGWKGRAGTAAQNSAADGFMREAVSALASEGKARVDRLTAGEQTIAAAITLRSGDTAWAWKIAYDETQARASPGVQLMIELTGSLLADASLDRSDSCAPEGLSMIEQLWRERLIIADRLIACGGASPGFAAACRLETMRRRAVATAKSLRNRLR